MLTKFRVNFGFFGFFKNFNNPNPNTSEGKTAEAKNDQWDSKNWNQMGHIMQKIKNDNQHKPKVLPIHKKDNDKLTVVMELDEVLLFTFSPDPRENWMTAPIRKWDFSVELPEFETWLDIYKREHLDVLLDYWINETEPVVWSCGHPAYVKKIVKLLCPQFPETHILTQENCNLVDEPQETLELFVKDLNILGRDLRRVVYVDSKPLNFWGTGDNSIPITVFTADNTDQHSRDDLLTLVEELKILQNEPNVRDVLSQRYKIEETQRESKLIF